MALSHTMKLIELSDIKIAKMLTDDGTATTYGTLVDMPGAMKITLSPKADSKQLRGDSVLVDVYGPSYCWSGSAWTDF